MVAARLGIGSLGFGFEDPPDGCASGPEEYWRLVSE